jgi:hypothetical protein
MTLPVQKPAAGSTGWHPAVWNLIDVINAIDERIRDVMGGALIGGAGIDAVVNDAGDTITINSTSLGDNESIQDLISTTLIAGNNVVLTYDDALGTILIDANSNSETIRDTIGATLVAGTNVTITVDDAANTITIASTGGSAYTAENARDDIGTALVGGVRTSIVVNDAGDTITVNNTGPRVVALTDGATITPNADTTDIGKVTIAGNRTIANPTGTLTGGQRLILRIKQDATGSRTITWGSNFRFTGGTAPTLTTTASKTDYLGFIYNSDDTKWDCVAVKLNF